MQRWSCLSATVVDVFARAEASGSDSKQREQTRKMQPAFDKTATAQFNLVLILSTPTRTCSTTETSS
jgi:hypothetical protein